MAHRLTPALLIRETKHFVIARHFHPNRETVTVLLLALALIILFCLPNRDRIAYEAVQIGMPRETLVQTLAGIDLAVTSNRDEETSAWRDRVKFPIRKYQVTVRDGKVTDKRVLP